MEARDSIKRAKRVVEGAGPTLFHSPSRFAASPLRRAARATSPQAGRKYDIAPRRAGR